jgi:nitrogen fixation protein
MRYFTPELYLRNQSEDDSVLNQVEKEWEGNVDRYQAYIDQTRPALPAGVLTLLDHFALHGAAVLAMGRDGESFVIVLQLDPAYAVLVLSYRLVREASINRAAFGTEGPPGQAHWLYDEWQLVAEEPPLYGHSILLSNGWEIELRFRDLQVSAVQPVLLSSSAQRRLDDALKAFAHGRR